MTYKVFGGTLSLTQSVNQSDYTDYLTRVLHWTDEAEALQCLHSSSRQRLIMP